MNSEHKPSFARSCESSMDRVHVHPNPLFPLPWTLPNYNTFIPSPSLYPSSPPPNQNASPAPTPRRRRLGALPPLPLHGSHSHGGLAPSPSVGHAVQQAAFGRARGAVAGRARVPPLPRGPVRLRALRPCPPRTPTAKLRTSSTTPSTPRAPTASSSSTAPIAATFPRSSATSATPG